MFLFSYFVYSITPDAQIFDEERPAFFRGYGKETRLKPHPCLDEEWSTSYRKTFLKPLARSKPTAHIKLPGIACEFDPTTTESYRKDTFASGFENNRQLFDKTSWITEANLHTD